jgi:hypothetical protein
MIFKLLIWFLTRFGALKWAFGFSEPGVPTIPLAVMWQNVTAGTVGPTITGTLTSGATTCTSMSFTNGLYAGMPISGTGIQPGTVVATPITSTSITLSLPATASGAQALTFGLNDQNQSIWAGPSFGGFPGPSAAAIASDTPDCPFNIPDAQVLQTTATYVPAPGRGLVTIASGTTTAAAIQYFINNAWVTVASGTISATVPFFGVMCDGVNVRWNNLSATASTFTFYRERSSKSTSI